MLAMEVFVPNLDHLKTLSPDDLVKAGIYLTVRGLRPIAEKFPLRSQDIMGLLNSATMAAVGERLWGGESIPEDYGQAQCLGLAFLSRFIPHQDTGLPY